MLLRSTNIGTYGTILVILSASRGFLVTGTHHITADKIPSFEMGSSLKLAVPWLLK